MAISVLAYTPSARGAALALVDSTNAVLRVEMVRAYQLPVCCVFETITSQLLIRDSVVHGSLSLDAAGDSQASFRVTIDAVDEPLVFAGTTASYESGLVDVRLQIDDYSWELPWLGDSTALVSTIPDGSLPMSGAIRMSGEMTIGMYTVPFVEYLPMSPANAIFATFQGATPTAITLENGQLAEVLRPNAYIEGDPIWIFTQLTFDEIAFVPEPAPVALLAVVFAVVGSRFRPGFPKKPTKHLR